MSITWPRPVACLCRNWNGTFTKHGDNARISGCTLIGCAARASCWNAANGSRTLPPSCIMGIRVILPAPLRSTLATARANTCSESRGANAERRPLEGLVEAFVSDLRFRVHVCAPSSHIYTLPVHQTEARPGFYFLKMANVVEYCFESLVLR